MSFATARRDIEKRLTDNWITTAIAYENVPFKPVAGTPWVKLRILENTVNRINVGNPGIHRATGLIAVEIYTKLNEGSNTGRGYADTIAAIFRDQQFGGITCREANVTIPGEFDGWWQTNVTIGFFWDGRYTV